MGFKTVEDVGDETLKKQLEPFFIDTEKLADSIFSKFVTEPFRKFMEELIVEGMNPWERVQDVRKYMKEEEKKNKELSQVNMDMINQNQSRHLEEDELANQIELEEDEGRKKLLKEKQRKILEKKKALDEKLPEQPDWGSTILHFAVVYPIKSFMEFLLKLKKSEKFINVKLEGGNQMTPLFTLTSTNQQFDRVVKQGIDMFIQFKADIEERDSNMRTPFLHCLKNSNKENALYLIDEHSADIDVQDKDQKSALHYACDNYDMKLA